MTTTLFSSPSASFYGLGDAALAMTDDDGVPNLAGMDIEGFSAQTLEELDAILYGGTQPRLAPPAPSCADIPPLEALTVAKSLASRAKALARGGSPIATLKGVNTRYATATPSMAASSAAVVPTREGSPTMAPTVSRAPSSCSDGGSSSDSGSDAGGGLSAGAPSPIVAMVTSVAGAAAAPQPLRRRQQQQQQLTGSPNYHPAFGVVDVNNPPDALVAAVLAKKPAQCSELEALIRRRAKNRMAKQASRQRRRRNEGELTRSVQQLSQRNAELEREAATASEENARLAREVAFLKRLISSSPEVSALYERVTGAKPAAAAAAAGDTTGALPEPLAEVGCKRRRLE